MTNKTEWMQMNNVWVSKEPVLPGVWRRKEGGHVVRGRATDSKTGKQRQVFRVLPDADAQTALKWLRDEQARIRKGVDDSPEKPRQRFAEFAASLFEHKVKVRDIKSGAGRNKWAFTLEHLIAGTTGPKSGEYVPGFGDFFLDKIETGDVERWKERMAALVAAGDYAPTSINTWISVLRVIMKAAKRAFDLPTVVTDGVRYLDTSEHDIYTDEEPNALLPAEVPPFMAKLRELFPQHFAMAYLGLITGLRPSTLRPLRRTRPRVRRGLEGEPAARPPLPHRRRGGDADDQAEAPLHDRPAAGGDARPPVARRHPAPDARAAGSRISSSRASTAASARPPSC